MIKYIFDLRTGIRMAMEEKNATFESQHTAK